MAGGGLGSPGCGHAAGWFRHVVEDGRLVIALTQVNAILWEISIRRNYLCHNAVVADCDVILNSLRFLLRPSQPQE